MTDAYERELFHGKLLDKATISALKEVEADLGYELTITQGVGTSVDASAGTHAGLNGEGGRVVDLAPFDAKRKLRALWRHGFFAYHRRTIPGLWSEHIHAGLVLNSFSNPRGIAASAFRQIAAWLDHRDGLKSNLRLPDSITPSITPYQYPPKVAPVPVFSNNITEARDQLVKAAHALGVAAVKLESSKRPTAAGRARMAAAAATIRGVRRTVNGLLRVTIPNK
jgi:hypothetical protein